MTRQDREDLTAKVVLVTVAVGLLVLWFGPLLFWR